MKLVTTVGLIVLVPTVVGRWIRLAVALTAGGDGGAGYPAVRLALLASSVVIVTVLFPLVVVSVVKPRGLTARGERHRQRIAAARRP